MVYSVTILSFVLLIAPGLGYATPQSPSLTVASQCVSTCPGHTLTLECTTVGPGITVWRGSAFNCSGNNILLRHSQFMSPYGVNGTCNNGEIIGYSLRVTADNCFTSLLNVTVSPGLIGQTIQCAHNNGQSLNPIGLHRIDIRTGYPPPNDIQMIDVRPGQFTFSWRPVQINNCSATYYNIIADHCGATCPNTTTHNTITCTGWTITRSPCTFSFALQTVVCEDITGNMSNPLIVILKELQAPMLFGIPVYSATTGTLESINAIFNEVDTDPVRLINGTIGFTTSYTITYTNAIHGITCGTATILTSNCISGRCSHSFDLSTSSCHPYADINITVFGTNQLGNGSVSKLVTVGAINTYIEVKFDFLTSRLQCIFLEQQGVNNMSCSIGYSPEELCLSNLLESENSASNTSSVTVELSDFPYSQSNMYCYTITASNGTHTVNVKGLFNAGCDAQHLSDGTHLLDEVSCGAPYLSLGIKNGIVCYNGIDTGAKALYFCSSCTSASTLSLSVRTCMPNGTWNGSVLQCDCDDHRELNVTMTVSITFLGLTISIIVCVFIIVVTVLARAKHKIQQELEQFKEHHVLYDEIELPEQIENVAYVSTVQH